MTFTVRLERPNGTKVCDVEIQDINGMRPETIVRDGVVYRVHGFGAYTGPRRPSPFSYRQVTAVFLPLDSVPLLPIGDTILPEPMLDGESSLTDTKETLNESSR